MNHRTPQGHDEKFVGFIRLCSDAKSKGTNSVIVAYPWVLGDNYDEVIESLFRLADAGLNLSIAT